MLVPGRAALACLGSPLALLLVTSRSSGVQLTSLTRPLKERPLGDHSQSLASFIPGAKSPPLAFIPKELATQTGLCVQSAVGGFENITRGGAWVA